MNQSLGKPLNCCKIRKQRVLIKFETKCQSKSGINHLSAPLVKLFNFIVSKGTFPDSWLTGMITPIFKSVNRSDLQNYRGFCVTSCLGKLFFSILNTRLSVYFHDKNILHSSQIGFLRGYRTTDNIFILMRTLIDKYVNNENRGKLFCCFVDFHRGGSTIYFRRGCTRLLLYFNTNKPHSFFLQNTSCIRKPQVISGGGVRTPCTLSLDPLL